MAWLDIGSSSKLAGKGRRSSSSILLQSNSFIIQPTQYKTLLLTDSVNLLSAYCELYCELLQVLQDKYQGLIGEEFIADVVNCAAD
jgi:hypothetical protein